MRVSRSIALTSRPNAASAPSPRVAWAAPIKRAPMLLVQAMRPSAPRPARPSIGVPIIDAVVCNCTMMWSPDCARSSWFSIVVAYIDTTAAASKPKG